MLASHLDSEGWTRFRESLVMRLPLDDAGVDDAMDQIPLKDIGRFIGASLKVQRLGRRAAAGPVGDHRRDPAGGRAVRARGWQTSRWRRDLRA